MQKFPLDELKSWFLEHKRDFPWREEPSAYMVWVSEVMLQQTQASVVIPYFLRWMEEFPTIEVLAKAPLEKVIKAWEGLGYYSRARNIHEAAKSLLKNYQAELPRNEEDLKKIKGLGAYTVGAILSFAFNEKKAAVDANVARVLSRYFLIEEDISLGSTMLKLRTLTEEMLPDWEPHIVMEALIELGALICKKIPRCNLCPLEEGCLAKKHAMTAIIPKKKKKLKTILLYRHVSILRSENHLLIRKGGPKEVMADLYEFPYFEFNSQKVSKRMIKEKIYQIFNIDATYLGDLLPISHTFTKYKAHLFPAFWNVLQKNFKDGYMWVSIEEIKQLPFSSGHRKILQQILGNILDTPFGKGIK